ncbi:hypothetical protein [Streptomyces sp. NPDC020681]|uniref:hypothetical protein n=1 Tax=Streptomyces sp. NPDC020681 TaxID=3365083 RepID=UPI003798E058
MGGVGTSILGRPRHLPRDRRASHHPTSDYTLNCVEPQFLWTRTTTAQAQAQAERAAALRAERKDAIRDFFDAAQTVERIAHHRFSNGQHDDDAGSAMHRLWFLQKCTDIVGSPELRGATLEYAERLSKAVWTQRPVDAQESADDRLRDYIGAHRDRFLQAARHELSIPELS